MPSRSSHRTWTRAAALVSGSCPRGSRAAGIAAAAFTMLSLITVTGLASCTSWGIRPESALMIAPPDDVWEASLDLLRDGEFKIEKQDNNTRTLQATKDIVLRMLADRATPATAQKIHHQVDLSVKPSGDNRSTVELIYRVEKVLEENEAFRFLQAIRDRLAMSGSGAARPRPLQ